jgi:hypothetical protein
MPNSNATSMMTALALPGHCMKTRKVTDHFYFHPNTQTVSNCPLNSECFSLDQGWAPTASCLTEGISLEKKRHIAVSNAVIIDGQCCRVGCINVLVHTSLVAQQQGSC